MPRAHSAKLLPGIAAVCLFTVLDARIKVTKASRSQHKMGDEAPAEEEPLLVEDTQAVWDAIEDGSNRLPALNIKQLINDDPDHVIQWLAKKGVTKLGDFKIQVLNQQVHTTGRDAAKLTH